jgi:hypothetical protein
VLKVRAASDRARTMFHFLSGTDHVTSHPPTSKLLLVKLAAGRLDHQPQRFAWLLGSATDNAWLLGRIFSDLPLMAGGYST